MTLVEFIPIEYFTSFYVILLYFIYYLFLTRIARFGAWEYSANFCLGIVLDHAES